MAEVPNIFVLSVLASAISPVRYPAFNVLSIAEVMRRASSFRPNAISYIKATDRIEASGLALFWPAISVVYCLVSVR